MAEVEYLSSISWREKMTKRAINANSELTAGALAEFYDPFTSLLRSGVAGLQSITTRKSCVKAPAAAAAYFGSQPIFKSNEAWYMAARFGYTTTAGASKYSVIGFSTLDQVHAVQVGFSNSVSATKYSYSNFTTGGQDDLVSAGASISSAMVDLEARFKPSANTINFRMNNETTVSATPAHFPSAQYLYLYLQTSTGETASGIFDEILLITSQEA